VKNFKLIKHAFANLYKELAIKIGAMANCCFNPPQDITLRVTHACNSRCITCDYWKNTDDPQELPTEEWIRILRDAKKWVQPCHIIFTGGEPFVKKGFCEILKYAKEQGFYTTVNSNGILFDKQGREKIFALNPDFIVFSLNSKNPKVHDYYKGVEHLHQRIIDAIKYKNNIKCDTLIGFMSLITKDSYRDLMAFAKWAAGLGVKSIDFGAIREELDANNPEGNSPHANGTNPFWKIDDLSELEKQLDLLASAKKSGLPITTPFHDLKMLKLYYKNPQALPKRRNCKTGFRKVIIFPNGELKLCYYYPPIGNIKNGNLKDIWFSKEAQRQRMEMLKCDTRCVVVCLREYNFREKVAIFFNRLGIPHP